MTVVKIRYKNVNYEVANGGAMSRQMIWYYIGVVQRMVTAYRESGNHGNHSKDRKDKYTDKYMKKDKDKNVGKCLCLCPAILLKNGQKVTCVYGSS